LSSYLYLSLFLMWAQKAKGLCRNICYVMLCCVINNPEVKLRILSMFLFLFMRRVGW